jgi:hypothetical protein
MAYRNAAIDRDAVLDAPTKGDHPGHLKMLPLVPGRVEMVPGRFAATD